MQRRFIVTANVPEDVVAAVQFAADYSLKVSALGGGHQLAGLALPECGVTIEMYKLQYLDFDPVTNLATVQASPVAMLPAEQCIMTYVLTGKVPCMHDKNATALTHHCRQAACRCLHPAPQLATTHASAANRLWRA